MKVRVRVKMAVSDQVKTAAEAEPQAVTWQEMAGGLSTLLSPAAALCFALAFWRFGQDLRFARNFFIEDGPLSHWQVWMVFGACVVAAKQWLNRRAGGKGDEPAVN